MTDVHTGEIIDLRTPGQDIEPIPQEESFVDVFERLGPHIENLADNWDEVRSTISTASSDEVVHFVYQQSLSIFTKEESNPVAKELFRNETANIEIRGRFSRQATREALHAVAGGAHALAHEQHTTGESRPTVQQLVLKQMVQASPNLKNTGLYTSDQLFEDTHANLLPIYLDIEVDSEIIQKEVFSYVQRGLDELLAFVDWASQVDQRKPSRLEAAMLDVLAIENTQYSSAQFDTLIGQIMQQAKAGELGNDKVLMAFCHEVLEGSHKDEGIEQSVLFVQRVLAARGEVPPDPADLLADNRAAWPETIEVSYRNFGAGLLENTRKRLSNIFAKHRPISKAIFKYDDLVQAFSAAYNYDIGKAKQPRHRGRVTEKIFKPRSIKNQATETISMEPAQPGFIVLSDATSIGKVETDQSRFENFVAKQAQNVGRNCRTDVDRLVEAVIQNPHAIGRQLLPKHHVTIDNRRHRLWSFGAHSGIAIPMDDPVNDDLRVIYTIYRPKGSEQRFVAISGIYKHDDYDRKVTISGR